MSNKKVLTEEQVRNRKKCNITRGVNGKNSRYYFGLHDFIQLNHNKYPLRDIANMFGIDRGVVSKYYKELGLLKYEKYSKKPFDITISLKEPLDRYMVNNHAQVINRETMVILKPKITKHGYYIYELAGTDKKLYYKLQHRLFAVCFLPNPKGKKEINHILGDKLNNRVFTLEWSTREENMRHFHDILMKDKINIPGNAKINTEEAKQIIKLLDEGKSFDEILNEVPSATKGIIKNIKWSGNWSKIRKK